jgi:hypothetical protein
MQADFLDEYLTYCCAASARLKRHSPNFNKIDSHDRPLREQKMAEIKQDLTKLKEAFEAAIKKPIAIGGKEAAKEKGKLLGQFLIWRLFPMIDRVQHAADVTEQTQSNLHIAFALAAHHKKHGKCPEQLDQLVPNYLDQVRPDLFSGKMLLYQPAKAGYLLYSVGVNGKDEQDRTANDDPRGDDITVRMPLPKLKEQ